MRPASSRLSIGFDWAGKIERICVLIEPGIARRLGEFCGFLRQKKLACPSIGDGSKF
jgi:hypothetical protein